jgi:exonuclease III
VRASRCGGVLNGSEDWRRSFRLTREPPAARGRDRLKNALLQPQPRALYQPLLGQGWTDAIKATHPAEPVYTFWDYLRQGWERNAGMRLDHILLSASLAPSL